MSAVTDLFATAHGGRTIFFLLWQRADQRSFAASRCLRGHDSSVGILKQHWAEVPIEASSRRPTPPACGLIPSPWCGKRGWGEEDGPCGCNARAWWAITDKNGTSETALGFALDKPRGVWYMKAASIPLRGTSVNSCVELSLVVRVIRYTREPVSHQARMVKDGSANASGTFPDILSLRYPALRVLVRNRSKCMGYSAERGMVGAAFRIVSKTHIDLVYPWKGRNDSFEHSRVLLLT
jgi:hypothetical protein